MSEIDHFLKEFQTFFSSIITSVSFDNRLRQALLYATMNGGKRIRPQLCFIFAKLGDNPAPHTDILYLASALEAVHCYSLVHDDLPSMDNDDLRRGKPTTHKKYSEAVAILVGDVLQSIAFELLSHHQLESSADIQIELVKILSQAIGAKGMVNGQFLDMYLDENFDPQNTNHVTQMHQQKTGALITASCQFGAILTKDKTLIEAAEKIGNLIGSLFQIQDDILDITQSSEVLGKTAGKDHQTNKPTITALMGLDGAKKQAKNLHDQLISQIENLPCDHKLLFQFIDNLTRRVF